MDFMAGRKRLGFAPLEGNESRKDANDALGFDIYDKSGNAPCSRSIRQEA